MTTALDLPHGMHLLVPEDVYHAKVVGLASKHALDRVLRSPAHYYAWATDAALEERSKALDFGVAAHCALLEPGVFARRYVIEPDFGPQRASADLGVTTEQGRENKTRKKAWTEEHADADFLLTAADMRAIRGIAEGIARNATARALLVEGNSEVTVRWRCPLSGLECKLRIDYDLPDIALCADLKTCEDASEDAFRRDIRKYGYRRTTAHYLDGTARIGQPRDYVYICAEKEPPNEVAVYRMLDEATARGASEIDKAKMVLARCIETGEWPGLGPGIRDIGLERWEK